jgi:hypothetical protein
MGKLDFVENEKREVGPSSTYYLLVVMLVQVLVRKEQYRDHLIIPVTLVVVKLCYDFLFAVKAVRKNKNEVLVQGLL